MDVGQVDGQVFAVVAGMGFDAAMLHDRSERRKDSSGPIAWPSGGQLMGGEAAVNIVDRVYWVAA